jgi:hypothetical protein
MLADLPFGVDVPGSPYLPRKRLWQAVFSVLVLVVTSSSLIAMGIGLERFISADDISSDDVNVAMDNTYRYFGGIYLGVALLALWSVARIEQRANALVVATGAVFLGGLGRIIAIVNYGAPSTAILLALIVELGAVFLALIMRRTIRPATELVAPG